MLTCMQAGGRTACRGEVELRTTPDRTDGRAFPRCEGHFEERLASAGRTLELTSHARPGWFSEADAGERWDEDY